MRREADMMRSKAVVLHARPSGLTSPVLTGRFRGRNVSPDSDSLWSPWDGRSLGLQNAVITRRIAAEVMTAAILFDLSSLSQMSLMNFNAHVCVCEQGRGQTAGLASCFNMSSSHWCVLSDQRCDLSRNIFIWRRDPLLSIPDLPLICNNSLRAAGRERAAQRDW